MPRVLIPQNPGLLSAVGMLLADVVKDNSRTVMLNASTLSPDHLDELFREMEVQGAAELRAEGVRDENVSFERLLDMRYKGQSFEIIVPHGRDSVEAFQQLHEKHYGHRNPGKPVEVVNLRLRSRGHQEKPTFPSRPEGPAEPPQAALLATRPAIFNRTVHDTAILDRAALHPGNTVPGPAIITEYSSTIVIPPATKARVDARSNLLLEPAP